jgi:hypothetical protein
LALYEHFYIAAIRDLSTPKHTLPESLRDSAVANVLETVVDLDLTTLADIELPRGYGRD